MKHLSAIFKRVPDFHPVPKPDDRGLKDQLLAAAENHKMETVNFQRASLRQLEEQIYVRETLRGVLSRIEDRKTDEHG